MSGRARRKASGGRKRARGGGGGGQRKRRRIHACTECDYRTAFKSALTKHMRTHTGEKPFACTVCDYRAAQKGHVTRHMKRKHKTTPTAINTRKIRRCAEPFTLFEIKEFATLEESLRSLHRRV